MAWQASPCNYLENYVSPLTSTATIEEAEKPGNGIALPSAFPTFSIDYLHERALSSPASCNDAEGCQSPAHVASRGAFHYVLDDFRRHLTELHRSGRCHWGAARSDSRRRSSAGDR